MDKAYDREAWSGTEQDAMVQAYLATALWSTTDDHGTPLDDRFEVDAFADDAVASAKADVADFYTANEADLVRWTVPGDAGHEFWLNRNGHGAGFWDKVYPGAENTAEYRERYHLTEAKASAMVEFNAAMERLSEASKVYGGVDLYVGDDGTVHAQ
jgi:hypothetical protein